jgi:hypothetical protein
MMDGRIMLIISRAIKPADKPWSQGSCQKRMTLPVPTEIAVDALKISSAS